LIPFATPSEIAAVLEYSAIMPFYIGKCSKPIDQSTIIYLEDPAQTETLEIGDVVQTWDHVFEWDENCLKASDLEP